MPDTFWNTRPLTWEEDTAILGDKVGTSSKGAITYYLIGTAGRYSLGRD